MIKRQFVEQLNFTISLSVAIIYMCHMMVVLLKQNKNKITSLSINKHSLFFIYSLNDLVCRFCSRLSTYSVLSVVTHS